MSHPCQSRSWPENKQECFPPSLSVCCQTHIFTSHTSSRNVFPPCDCWKFLERSGVAALVKQGRDSSLFPTHCPPMEEGLTTETPVKAGKQTKRSLSVSQDIHSEQLAGLWGALLC